MIISLVFVIEKLHLEGISSVNFLNRLFLSVSVSVFSY